MYIVQSTLGNRYDLEAKQFLNTTLGVDILFDHRKSVYRNKNINLKLIFFSFAHFRI